MSPQTRRPSDKERLEMKWYRREPMTQQELADLLGVKRQHIYEIEKSAMRKIVAALEARE